MGRGEAGQESAAIEQTAIYPMGGRMIRAAGSNTSGPSDLLRALAASGKERLARAGGALQSLASPLRFQRGADSIGIAYKGRWKDIDDVPTVREQISDDRRFWAEECEQAGVVFDSEETSLHPIEMHMLEWARLDAERRVNQEISPLGKFRLTLARSRGGERALQANSRMEALYDDAVSQSIMEYIARIRLPDEVSDRTVAMRMEEMREQLRIAGRALKQTGRGDVRSVWLAGDWQPAATAAPKRTISAEEASGWPVPESIRAADDVADEAPTLVTAAPVTAAEHADQMFAAEREAHTPVVRTKTKPRPRKSDEARQIDSDKIDQLAVTIAALKQTSNFAYELDYLSGVKASNRKAGQGAIAQLDAAKALNALAAVNSEDVSALKAALDKFVVSCEESTGITGQNYGKLYLLAKNDPKRFTAAIRELQVPGALEGRVDAFQNALGLVTDKKENQVQPLRPIQSVQLASYLLAAQGEDVPLYCSPLYNVAAERLGGSKLKQGATAKEAFAFAMQTTDRVREELALRGMEFNRSQILGLFYWALSDRGKRYAKALVADREKDPQSFSRDVLALRAAALLPPAQPQTA